MSDKATTWSKIAEGDRVLVGGREYEVLKIKPTKSGKKLAVSMSLGKRGSFAGVVKPKDRVHLAPLHEPLSGGKAQRRWAKPEELKAKGLDAGDPDVVKPPAKAKGGPWVQPRDKAERLLGRTLGAHLVGESTDVRQGYYVPPVDVTTVASHMALFHPNTYDAAKDEATMIAGHDHEHRMVLAGSLKLGVNHWHTKERPAS